MKILYVYDAIANWGGVQRIFVDKMNSLAADYGAQVYLLTTNQGEHQFSYPLHPAVRYKDIQIQLHWQYRYKGLRRYWERFRRHRLLIKRLEKEIKRIQPDVIVSTIPLYIPELLKIKGKAKLVAESHSGYDHVMENDNIMWRRRIEARLLCRQLQKVDVLVSLTESDGRKWCSILQNVKVIPNLVNLNQTGHYSNYENKRVIFVGRFAHQKSIPDLLRIWQKVHQRHPDWELHMYGEGEHKDKLMREIEAMNANIVVHQPTQDILQQYIESSIFVLTSLYEPFGLVIVEAMSCGLPVVTFEGDGPNAIVCDGKDGYIVADRNIQAFADRVCQLIEDKELRQKIGQTAIQSAQRYSAERIMPMWKELFESLIGES